MWGKITFDELPYMVAEDSADDLLLLERTIRETGIVNPRIVAASGQATVDCLSARSTGFDSDGPFPILLFLDLLMPNGDGFQVLRWLKNNPHPPLAVVIHTGVESEELLQQARDLGATYYLPKGTRPEAIREVFTRVRQDLEQEKNRVA